MFPSSMVNLLQVTKLDYSPMMKSALFEVFCRDVGELFQEMKKLDLQNVRQPFFELESHRRYSHTHFFRGKEHTTLIHVKYFCGENDSSHRVVDGESRRNIILRERDRLRLRQWRYPRSHR